MKYLLKMGSTIFFGLSTGFFVCFFISKFEASFYNYNTVCCDTLVSECCETDCFIESDKFIQLNFDKIFPETQISKVFDSCIRVYQDLDLICDKKIFKNIDKNSSQLNYNFDIFTDLIVGRLFDVKVVISKVPVFKQEDIEYLNKIFDKILFEYKSTCESCHQFVNNPKSENVYEIIKEIKGKLCK